MSTRTAERCNSRQPTVDAEPPPPPGAHRRFFDRWSQFYDLPFVQWATYWPVHAAVMRNLRGIPKDRVLDIGCGTGQLTARIARQFPASRVTGCDFSQGMLSHAIRRKTPVHWTQGDAGCLPFASGAFDVIVSTEAFHWFPDQDGALREFRRVLSPGGRLLVALASSPSTLFADALHAGSRLLGEPFYWPTAREMRERVERAGFHVIRQERIFRLPGGIVLPPILTHASRPLEATRR
jgi:SAM-dependent methyltransferase